MNIVNTKPISESLQQLIQKANSSFEEGKHCVVLAYEQAIKEGFTPQEAKKLLFEKITAFSDRTIYRYLPPEAKDQKAVELASSSKKNLPSLTSGNDSVESKQLEPLPPLTEEEKTKYLEMLFIIETHLKRTNFRSQFAQIECVLQLESVFRRIITDFYNIKDEKKIEKKYYDMVRKYASNWIQSIAMKNVNVASTQDDGSIYCWLCLLDSVYQPNEKVYYDDKTPTMYSNTDLAGHILIHHRIDEEGWSPYIPYLPKNEHYGEDWKPRRKWIRAPAGARSPEIL